MRAEANLTWKRRRHLLELGDRVVKNKPMSAVQSDGELAMAEDVLDVANLLESHVFKIPILCP